MDSVYIIAEAGVNHDGSLEKALRLVEAAASSGADAVKFQTFKAERLATAAAPKAPYQRRLTPPTDGQLEMLAKLELSRDDHFRLCDAARETGIDFLSSAFDLESLEMLRALALRYHKVPSGAITDLPFLEAVGRTRTPVLLSTGMSDEREIEAAVEVLIKCGTPSGGIILLHCTTEYPAPLEDVNLLAMVELGRRFGLHVGYSDHTEGTLVAVAAAALGARVIEKHLTLDREAPGPDHRASVEPDEFRQLVRSVRAIEVALGDPRKQASASERINRGIVRKSIVAARPIRRGELLDSANLTTKRPGDGISPMRWHSVVGTFATRDYDRDEQIELP